MFTFGDIVLVRFPFTDLSGDKRRPALVVSKRENNGDIVLCFITSVARSGPGAVSIRPDTATGLKQPSVVRFDKIATLNTSLVTGRIGTAPAAWLLKHGTDFHGVFGFVAVEPIPNAL